MKKTYVTKPKSLLVSKRAQALIDDMLKEMQGAIKSPDDLNLKNWERLFGSKESMVMNLQKLVQSLVALPTEVNGKPSISASNQEMLKFTQSDLEILTAWLQEQRATLSNGS